MVDHVQQVFRRHVAGRRRGERATADAGGPDLLGNLLDNSHGLFRSGALVTPVECVRGHYRIVDFIDVAGHGPFRTALVQHQPDKRHVVPLLQAAYYFLRVRDLRDPLGIDKTKTCLCKRTWLDAKRLQVS